MPHKPIPPAPPPGDHTDELLAMVAHELRRPLTALLGALATLQHRDQALSARQQQELLGMARRQGEQLQRLLDQLLAAAGVDRGAAGLVGRSLVDAATLAEEAGQAARLAHPDHPITIEVAGRLLVRVDPLAISRVLDNLLDNAAAHSPNGRRSGCRPTEPACTRCWPSRTRDLASHRPSATGSSSSICGWTGGRPRTRRGWGLACTSPGGLLAPTAASCRSLIRQAGGVHGWSCGCRWPRQLPAAPDPSSRRLRLSPCSHAAGPRAILPADGAAGPALLAVAPWLA